MNDVTIKSHIKPIQLLLIYEIIPQIQREQPYPSHVKSLTLPPLINVNSRGTHNDTSSPIQLSSIAGGNSLCCILSLSFNKKLFRQMSPATMSNFHLHWQLSIWRSLCVLARSQCGVQAYLHQIKGIEDKFLSLKIYHHGIIIIES